MEDTEWNDILKRKGIIKDEPKKSDENEVEESAKQQECGGDELDELLNLDEDSEVIAEYRRKRIAELQKASASLVQFGDVREISAEDYLNEVNKAGGNIWVVLLLYERGIPICTLMCQFLDELACRFPTTKFLKSRATLCVANFPESNLPAIFIYNTGVLKKQLIGKETFGGEKVTVEALEWLLTEAGAIKGRFKQDPRASKSSKKIFSTTLLGNNLNQNDSDDSD